MKKKVYISGAIAHYDLEERMAAFNHAARYLCESVRERRIAGRALDGTHEKGHRPAFGMRLHLHAAGLGIEQGCEAGT